MYVDQLPDELAELQIVFGLQGSDDSWQEKMRGQFSK